MAVGEDGSVGGMGEEVAVGFGVGNVVGWGMSVADKLTAIAVAVGAGGVKVVTEHASAEKIAAVANTIDKIRINLYRKSNMDIPVSSFSRVLCTIGRIENSCC